MASDGDPDVVIVEVGGTVGDIECLPFLEAIRQMRKDVGRANVLYVHVTLLPALAATGELKTKPTQHSVKELRGIGIQPDVIVLRSDHQVSDEIREKIALFTDVAIGRRHPGRDRRDDLRGPAPVRGVRAWADSSSASSASAIPTRRRTSPAGGPSSSGSSAPSRSSRSRLVGKYIELPDAYLSRHRGAQARRLGARGRREDPLGRLRERSTRENLHEQLDGAAGILVPGGFGHRGIEGKVLAAHFARDHRVPYLGLCLGLQCARHRVRPRRVGTHGRQLDRVRHVHRATRSSTSCRTSASWRTRAARCAWASTRPGSRPGSKAAAVYGQEVIYERHRHRFEVNNRYRADARGGRDAPVRPVARRPARRDRRAAGPPVVRGQPVPPGVQEPARAAAPALRRLRRGSALGRGRRS